MVDPVLVLAPTGCDAGLISETLSKARVRTEVCATLDEFAGRMGSEAAAGVLAEEALPAQTAPLLARALREQPAWSDFPLILMVSRQGSHPAVARFFEDRFNISLLERPVRMQTLTSAVRSALRQRRRQYELRDHLADEQRTEERLRQTQKLESLGVLAGGVAHDFNNLLTGIIGNISLALDGTAKDNPTRRFLEDAVVASQRAADLTRQLLAYSGKGRFQIQRIDVSELVRQISALIHTSISKNVQLKLALTDPLPAVEADSSQLQQIVMNLIINAAEAIGPEKNGLVVVETGMQHASDEFLKTCISADSVRPGQYVFLDVRDTGCGIDGDTLSKIFDPFFTTKFMGRGLGLAAVLGIVRGHNGALRVDSTPGAGSCFRVLFPPAQGEAVRPRKARVENKNLMGSGTILVVDDEEIVRKISRNVLENFGYRALLAENGEIAVDLFARMPQQISLVLLDMTMPVMSGAETLPHLQRMRPDVKVILTSGYSEMDATRRFSGTGLAGFLQKPFTAAQLAEKVKAVLERDGDSTVGLKARADSSLPHKN
jgi:signal transduction histidine kinase/CheY-like chemotaxis protein